MKAETSRYALIAITLHWVMAALLLFMIWLGWNMDDHEARYQLHKSVGILLLFLTVVRVIWRAMNPPPPLPEEMPAHEKLASHLVHMAFYGLMIVLPLAGWLLVSTSKFKVPTVLFGTISWPHLPAPDFLRGDLAHAILENIHSKGAWVLIILLGLHVAGAVKHEIGGEEGVLKKMLPGLFGKVAPPKTARGYLRAFGTAIIAFALVALIPIAGSGSSDATPAEAAPVAEGEADTLSPNWTVNYEQSEIRFSGEYDGAGFTGTFGDWTADIEFHPDDLAGSEALVTVRTATADAGKKLYNDSLKGQEWFDTNTFPEARIRLDNFRETDTGYTADATISLKTELVTVPLDFTLDIDGDIATLNATTVMNRKAFDLGQASDPAGTWVGEDVTVTVTGTASRN